MNKVVITIAIVSVLSLSAVLLSHPTHHNLKNNSSFVSFFEYAYCQSYVAPFQCEDIQNDPLQSSFCLSSSLVVFRLTQNNQTSPDGYKLLEPCRNFMAYSSTASPYQNINQNNYYFDCFLNPEVIKYAKLSPIFYEKSYAPKQIACAGY